MLNAFPLEQARRAVRDEICPKCRLWRGPKNPSDRRRPSTCEHGCSLFAELDRAARSIDLRDPMLSCRAAAFADAISRLRARARRSGHAAPDSLLPKLIPLLQHFARRD